MKKAEKQSLREKNKNRRNLGWLRLLLHVIEMGENNVYKTF
jgi:hypothetical protein